MEVIIINIKNNSYAHIRVRKVKELDRSNIYT